MFEAALVIAALLLTASTCLLLVAGRGGPVGRPTRLVVLVLPPLCGLLSVALGSEPMVGLAVGLAVAAVAFALPRHWSIVGAGFFASLLVAFGLYAAYLIRATALLGLDPLGVVLGLVLFLLELGAMALITTSAFEMVDARCAAPPPLPPPPEVSRWPVVCLQVPTYNEPPDLVIETIRSLAALDYPALRLQVIDNNTADEGLWRPVEAECARLSAAGLLADFVHLPTWPGYKAGALNWGLAHLRAGVEIVGVVDADYVVGPDFLRATIPYFEDPGVAFVQTPQDYRAWEQSAFYRACYVGFAHFFRIGMVSRARRNAIIFAGTMGLVRRSALEAIGGWDERIITEDAEASLRILERGHRAVYVPRAYGHGIMPLTYEGLRKQRFRWAFGGIQILRRHWRALLPWSTGSGLTLGQRYDYLVGGLWWFNDALTFGFTLFAFAAALGLLVGRPFVVQRLSPAGVVLPLVFLGLNLVRYLWALRSVTGASPVLALAALRVNLSLSWIIALASARGLTQERGVFLRTPKFRGAAAVREIGLVWAETALAGIALVLLVATVLWAVYSALGAVLAVLLGWALLIYGSAIGYALGDPTRAPLSAALREKAALELAPRVGRVVRSPRTWAGLVGTALAIFILAGAIAVESARPPIAGLPAPEAPQGPLGQPPVGLGSAPSSPAPGSPSPSAGPGAGSTGSATPGGLATARPSGPLKTPAPTATPPAPTATPSAAPRPTPPVATPTPKPLPTPPVPTPTPRRS